MNRAEFLLHCDAMVMPRRMGEGKREERKRGSARSEALETCREEDEGASIANATLAEQSLTGRLFPACLKMVGQAVKVHHQ